MVKQIKFSMINKKEGIMNHPNTEKLNYDEKLEWWISNETEAKDIKFYIKKKRSIHKTKSGRSN